MISSPGVGTGLDINSIVQQLVAAEGDAKTSQLVNRRSTVEAKVSAFGNLQSTLSSFQSALEVLQDEDTFQGSTVTVGDSDVFTASVSGSVANSTYQVEVQTLAEAHRILSQGFADADTVVGTGEMTIQVGAESFTLTIDSENDTLAGIRDAINAADDNDYVTATIINVDDGFGGTESKLILTANATGTDNEIVVTVDDDDLNDTDTNGLSALVYDPDGLAVTNMSEANAAADAVILIDGQQVTSSDNSISDAIDNITINLKEARPGETFDLKLELNKSKITNAVQTLVDNFNILANLMRNLSSYNVDTGESGVLLGDLTLQSLNSSLRRELTATVSGLTGDLTNVISLGITTNADGTLSLDSTRLSDAIDSDLNQVKEIFTADDGIANQLDDLLAGYLGTTGTIQGKTDGLNNTIKDIDESLLKLSQRLETLELQLLQKFSAMDALVARLNTTNSFLSSQLANLPTPGR